MLRSTEHAPRALATRAAPCRTVLKPLAKVRFLEAALQRGDARVVAEGNSLIANAMSAYVGRDNAPLFEGLPATKEMPLGLAPE